jgi:hypothetical protein
MPSWLEGWQYRKSHVINPASGAGTGYQIRITVHYGSGTDSGEHVYLNGKCRTDFGDIRFTDDDGVTELAYWMEEKVDGDHAIFWVKVNDDLSTTQQTIYIYYGNPTATTTSNPNATFIFFDHFTSLNTSIWTPPSDSTYFGWTIDNGTEFVMYAGTRGKSKFYNGHWSTYSVAQYEVVNRAIEVCMHALKVNAGDFYAYHNMGVAFDDDTSPPPYRCYGRGGQVAHKYTSETGLIWSSGSWNGAETPPEINGLAITPTAIKAFRNYALQYTELVAISGTKYLHMYMGVGEGYYRTNWGELHIDWIRIRKYVEPEPSHGIWGSEETTAYYIYVSDSAVGFDVKVSLPLTQTYARLVEMESIVSTLRYVTLNDYVLHTDYNGVVEACQTFLKLAEALVSELFMYDPEVRSKLEEVRLAILKLRKVRVFDIVSSRDHNKVVEAILKIREFIILVRQKLGLS